MGCKPSTPEEIIAPKNFLNVCILGDSNVGKTCLTTRFMGRNYPGILPVPTITDLELKTLRLPNGEKFNVRLWDTAGMERFQSITANFVKQCEAAILVYDETDPKTLFNLAGYWFPLVRTQAPNVKKILVIGNKHDEELSVELADRNFMYLKALAEMAGPYNVTYIRASAMNDDTSILVDVFDGLCKKSMDIIKEADPTYYQEFLIV